MFRLVNALSIALPVLVASAQGTEPPKTGKLDAEPSEEARRSADSPFRWIIINGQNTAPQKPQKPAAQAKPKATAAPSAPRSQQSAAAPASVPSAPRNKAEASVAAPAASSAEISKAAEYGRPQTPEVSSGQGAAEPAVTKPPEDRKPAPPPPVLKLVNKTLPEPPSRAYSEDKQDTVSIRFTVRPDGSVADVRVHESTNPRLNPYVVRAVSEWRFEPIQASTETEVGFVFDPQGTNAAH